MKNILIIGGSNFIGPHVIDSLLKRGHRITVFNRGRIKKNYPQSTRFICGDRNNGFPNLEHFETVIDMCAYHGLQTKIALDELKFDFFIHMSTAAIYKKTEIFPVTENSPLGDWPLWGTYNRGKVECERVLEKSGVKYASLRPVYVLGPNNYLYREQFIYSRIENGLPLILPGNGQALAQFVSVKDVAKSLALLAEKKLDGAFNCAGDEIITLKGLVEEMARIADKEAIIQYNPYVDGKKFNEKEFPFANENFIVSNKKMKDAGIVFNPLLTFLKEDYENCYRLP